MRASFTILFFTIGFSLFGQIVKIDKCGLDDSPYLNNDEAEYFNIYYKDKKGDFDFNGKVVAFFTGSSGTTKSSKVKYFEKLKDKNQEIHEWQAKGTQLYILTKEEKEMSGSYDVIFVSWSKLNPRRKLIKKLKNSTQKNDKN